MTKLPLCLALLLCSSYTIANASDTTASEQSNAGTPLKLGINAGVGDDGYRTKNSVSVLPHAFYDNNRWYIEGTEAGYYYHKDDNHQLRLGITYDGQAFDPTDDVALRGLLEREFSVLAHASYMHITPVGGFRAKIAMDALARYEAPSGSLAHLSRFRFFDDKLTIYPSLGVAWYSKGYNQYYYGVSEQEQQDSGIPAYQAKASFNPYVSAMSEYTINDKWSLFGHGRIEKLAKTQQNSPLVDGSLSSTARFGVSYSF